MVLKFTEYTYYYNENNIKHIYYIPPHFLFFLLKQWLQFISLQKLAKLKSKHPVYQLNETCSYKNNYCLHEKKYYDDIRLEIK